MLPIRAMIVESDPSALQTVVTALGKEGNFDVIATASSRESAIKQLTGMPDIVILNPDILKGHTLSRFIRSVQTKSPRSRVMYVLVKTLPDDHIISDIKTGIRGYFRLTDTPAAMSKAVHAVHSGEIWAERRILEKAISKPMLLPETLQANVPGLPPLTNREMEVLTMVLQGASNREIADRNSISERTVKTHLYRVYRKLNVKSRTKAIALLSHS
ncbi:MAG TPA: response regulator transcription factor [Nitrospirota bacterium]|nr:response regulator transcription factor [Nitrospirota bacterium]